MIALKWHWYLSPLVSSRSAGSETIKPQPATGRPGEDETFLKLTMKNDCAHSVFACGSGPTLLKAGPIHLPVAAAVRCCDLQQLPLFFKKREEKGY